MQGTHDLLLAGLFFLSGFAAILYQLVWQRMLFALVGINVDAVTLIVTTFIAGLGFGSLLGGYLSRRHRHRLVTMFALVELGIGTFGVVSPALFGIFREWAPAMSALQIALATAALILPPTMAMGATLPILVTHAVARAPSVGLAVGTLYGVNTLGSAFAGFAAGLGVMHWLGQGGAVALAAAGNLTVAATALVAFRRTAR
ncbi:MAG: fused MFS/spermidine synthase [Burkholderiales bacterium]